MWTSEIHEHRVPIMSPDEKGLVNFVVCYYMKVLGQLEGKYGEYITKWSGYM